MKTKTPQHISLPIAHSRSSGGAEVFRPYRPAPEPAATVKVQRPSARVAAPVRSVIAPELRAWLETQERILAYWVSCPDEQFVPPVPPATRSRDRKILAALKKLLA